MRRRRGESGSSAPAGRASRKEAMQVWACSRHVGDVRGARQNWDTDKGEIHMRSGLRVGVIASAILVVGSMIGLAGGGAGAASSTLSSLSAGTISLLAGATTGASGNGGAGNAVG